ncbi:hypothetical protein [Anaerofustis stercorihominis]|uniref:hypothetical protein n=1 Tax=Anaerofustis stercorihominis TaxID=214853 RepID=UPI002672E383|nr:hypothetical protein [Anaerofustis stercorihominis]
MNNSIETDKKIKKDRHDMLQAVEDIITLMGSYKFSVAKIESICDMAVAKIKASAEFHIDD